MCISKLSKRRDVEKEPARGDQLFQDGAQLKRERGEFLIHPAVAPVSHELRVFQIVISPGICTSGGQNLAALSAAAGQNLTAVGGSHSLTETVNLGTVTLAGLVGTLHYITPPDEYFSYARQPKWPQQHIITDHTWSC